MNAVAARLPNPIRVLIADDHRLFAEALEAILAAESRIEVVGRARNGAEALEMVLDLNPDLVLMDISMPVMDGVEATRRIREARPEACVLMLTGSSAVADVDRSRDAGAAGYVTKDRIASELVGDGIYVTRLHYLGVVEPRQGILTGMTRDGSFRIRDGKLAEPLVNLRFTVAVPDVLADVPGLTRETTLANQSAFYGERFAYGALVPALATARFDITGVGGTPGI